MYLWEINNEFSVTHDLCMYLYVHERTLAANLPYILLYTLYTMHARTILLAFTNC